MEAAIKRLFDNPKWDQRQLNDSIIEALRTLELKLRDTPRTISHVATLVSMNDTFPGIDESDVKKASVNLAAMSKGALVFDGTTFTVLTSYDELRRRSASSVVLEGFPLRHGQLRSPQNGLAKSDDY